MLRNKYEVIFDILGFSLFDATCFLDLSNPVLKRFIIKQFQYFQQFHHVQDILALFFNIFKLFFQNFQVSKISFFSKISTFPSFF